MNMLWRVTKTRFCFPMQFDAPVVAVKKKPKRTKILNARIEFTSAPRRHSLPGRKSKTSSNQIVSVNVAFHYFSPVTVCFSDSGDTVKVAFEPFPVDNCARDCRVAEPDSGIPDTTSADPEQSHPQGEAQPAEWWQRPQCVTQQK